MSPAAFMSMCAALGCVVAMLALDDTDASIRFGLAGIVFAILARVERRGGR